MRCLSRSDASRGATLAVASRFISTLANLGVCDRATTPTAPAVTWRLGEGPGALPRLQPPASNAKPKTAPICSACLFIGALHFFEVHHRDLKPNYRLDWCIAHEP